MKSLLKVPKQLKGKETNILDLNELNQVLKKQHPQSNYKLNSEIIYWFLISFSIFAQYFHVFREVFCYYLLIKWIELLQLKLVAIILFFANFIQSRFKGNL